MKIFYAFLVLFLFPVFGYSQVNVEDIRYQGSGKGIHFMMSMDFTLDKGNSEKIEIVPSSQISYHADEYYTFLYLSGKYEESSYQKVNNKAKIHYRMVYKLNELFYPEFFLQSEYDEFIELKERDLVGGGMRFNLIHFNKKADSTQNIGLSLGLGAMYEYELINAEPNYTNNNARMTSYIGFRWDPSDNFRMALTTYFQPLLNNWVDIKLYNETELAFYINKYLAFTFDLTLYYHTEPPEGVKNYDLEIKNGFRLDL